MLCLHDTFKYIAGVFVDATCGVLEDNFSTFLPCDEMERHTLTAIYGIAALTIGAYTLKKCNELSSLRFRQTSPQPVINNNPTRKWKHYIAVLGIPQSITKGKTCIFPTFGLKRL